MRRAVVLSVIVVAAMLPGIRTADAGSDFSCSQGVAGDFNGDGYQDLAVGSPNEDFFGETNAGEINVLYGSASGITDQGSQLWFQGPSRGFSPGDLQGSPESNDRFGSCLVAGDFNGDGKDDLAIGVPFDKVGDVRAGSVAVIYGGANGLKASGNQLWTEESPGIGWGVGKGDTFGAALASGDFNGDGVDDLAIGIPLRDFDTHTNVGAVGVLYGKKNTGLVATGNQLWMQGSGGIQGHPEDGDRFGAALAAGDFNKNGKDDLAIGVPGEGVIQGQNSEGLVQVLYGGAAGLRSSGNQIWYESSPGLHTQSKTGDAFGSSLAAGDFDGDGYADLAVGAPFRDSASKADIGQVVVLYGSPNRLESSRARVLKQGKDGMPDTPESGDHFGATLATGDLNGDGYADLAIGVPLEDVGSVTDAGATSVVYGSASGLDPASMATPSQFVTQQWTGAETSETGDEFGSALVSGDYNGDGKADLTVGIPLEDVTYPDQGAIVVVYGTAAGLSSSGAKRFTQDTGSIPGDALPGDTWGAALG